LISRQERKAEKKKNRQNSLQVNKNPTKTANLHRLKTNCKYFIKFKEKNILTK